MRKGVAIVLVAFAIIVLSLLYFKKSKPVDYNFQAQLILESCSNVSSKHSCYSSFFKNISFREGLVYASKTLKSLQKTDQEALRCHGLAHIIADNAVKRSPDLWIDLISKANTSECAGGYLHGIIEGHIASDPTFVVDAKSILDICGRQPPNSSSACGHAFGHVLLFQFEGDINKASTVCSDLSSFSSECYNGMFMEDAFRDMLFEHGLVQEHINPTVDPKRFAEVKDVCFRFKNNLIASHSCWANLGHLFADFYKPNYKKAYDACEDGPTEKDRRRCYFRAISSLVILQEFSKTEDSISLCLPYKKRHEEDAYSKCIGYIVATLVYHSDAFTNRAIDICLNSDTNDKEGCFRVIGVIFSGRMDNEEKKKACNYIPSPYRESCLSANNEDPFKSF